MEDTLAEAWLGDSSSPETQGSLAIAGTSVRAHPVVSIPAQRCLHTTRADSVCLPLVAAVATIVVVVVV